MDRSRYEGYVAARDAVAIQVPDPLSAEILSDLAESLLLARDMAEAEEARERAIEALGLLVDRGGLARRTAARLWVHLRACGPQMHWPPSWDRAISAAPDWAVRGH